MSAVARALSYSHSAISQQLGLLQKEAGVVLFERVGRNVKVTPAGEGLVRNTEAILAGGRQVIDPRCSIEPSWAARAIVVVEASRSPVEPDDAREGRGADQL